MSFTDYLPALIFAVVSTLTPGGATTWATASGINFGLLRSLPFIGGVAVGIASMTGMAASGLGAIFMAQPTLQWVAKMVEIVG